MLDLEARDALYKEINALQQRVIELEDENKNLRQIRVTGWKGKDKIKIKKDGKNWIVIEHRKDKKTKMVEVHNHYVKSENVAMVQSIVENYCFGHGEIKPREVWSRIIKQKKLSIDLDAFNGGSNRAKIYFPYFYWPIKVLEGLKIINYESSGKITLKD